MNDLVVSPLQEGWINGNQGLEAIAGHPSGQGHSVLLSNTDINKLLRQFILQLIETRTGRHRRRNPDNAGIMAG